MNKLLRLLLLAVSMTFVAAPTRADDASTRPLRLIVPFSPGGTNDGLARLMQGPLGKALGRPVIVENKPGAGGAIGAKYVASIRDGDTLLFTNSSLVTTALVQKNVGYDPLVDLVPVALVSDTPLLLMAHASVPFSDLPGLLAYAKAHPGELEYAVAGLGSFAHLAVEELSQAAGIKMLRVVYQGAMQSTEAVIKGEAKIALQTPSDTINQFVTSGQIKAIAVSSPGTSPIAPGVPTIAATLPGYAAEAWFGVFAGAATAPPVVNRLNAALAATLADPAVAARIRGLGMMPRGGTAQAFGAMLRREHATFAKVVRTPGFSVE